jgi:type II secretory ATPase GspE/PulE/Tfp pilus assembly ATPase PilB-like protein
MVLDDAIRDSINAGAANIAETALKSGMRPIIEDGRAKVAAGITTESEIAGVVFNANV